MIPVSLSIKGFLSYKELVEIDFTSFNLACISGENGAGKSSLLDAITWALFGRARKHDESVINLESPLAEVKFIFDYEGNQYQVIRSNPRGVTKQVELFINKNGNENHNKFSWKPLTERTIRETDQKIIDILRLDYESFINASFLLQGEADQFTQQTPYTRKRILSQILGLETWEEYRSRAAQKRKSIESEIDTLDGRLTEILGELGEEENRKKHLLSLEKDLSHAHQARLDGEKLLGEMQSVYASLEDQANLIDSLTSQIDIAENKIIQTQERLNQRQQERNTYQEILSQSDTINKEYENWKSAQESLSDWERTAEKFREQENKRQDPLLQIAAEEARLNQELDSLEKRHQELLTSLEELPILSKQLADIKNKISQAESDLEKRDQMKHELDESRQNQAAAKAENPLLFQEMKDLERRINELKDTEGALCPLCGQELSPKERNALIKSLETEGKELGDRYRKNSAVLKEFDQVVKDLQLQITEFSLVDKTLRNLKGDFDKIENQINHLENQKDTWETKYQEDLKEIQILLKTEAFAENARQLLSGIDDELKKIGYDATEHDNLRKLVKGGAEIQDKKSLLDNAVSALKPLDREILEITKTLESEQLNLKNLTVEVNQSQQALQSARDQAPDISEAEKNLLELKEQENILQREVGAAQQKVAVLENQKNRKTELERERQERSGLVKQYKQLEAAFGKDGIPALLIEQALPNIESKANQILDRLSAGTMSIRFLTQRSYRDASREDLKETLDIQIRDQSGFRDYEMYSGGESFRINFAIRLALSHVLAQRAGAKLQTLVVDEGFGSQDAIGRQRLIEAINLVRDDFKKILVITHIEQIKDAFSTQLLVEKTPQGSQVTLV